MIEETTIHVNAPLWISIGITLVLIMILVVLVKSRKKPAKKGKTVEQKAKGEDKEWIFN